jgi:hypothetical protein
MPSDDSGAWVDAEARGGKGVLPFRGALHRGVFTSQGFGEVDGAVAGQPDPVRWNWRTRSRWSSSARRTQLMYACSVWMLKCWRRAASRTWSRSLEAT